MKTGLYAPQGRDIQQTHTRDEFYLPSQGRGTSAKGSERRTFAANDAILIEAGAEHGFKDFYRRFRGVGRLPGPEDGEAAPEGT